MLHSKASTKRAKRTSRAYVLKRQQLPDRLAYAITINKALNEKQIREEFAKSIRKCAELKEEHRKEQSRCDLLRDMVDELNTEARDNHLG